jgi:hypothetical protein
MSLTSKIIVALAFLFAFAAFMGWIPNDPSEGEYTEFEAGLR